MRSLRCDAFRTIFFVSFFALFSLPSGVYADSLDVEQLKVIEERFKGWEHVGDDKKQEFLDAASADAHRAEKAFKAGSYGPSQSYYGLAARKAYQAGDYILAEQYLKRQDEAHRLLSSMPIKRGRLARGNNSCKQLHDSNEQVKEQVTHLEEVPSKLVGQ